VERDPRAEVGGLVVDERFRGSGVGRLLMQQAEDWAREKGYREVVLRSNVIREHAHRFYESLGYTVTQTQKHFRKNL
jgi:GNAT superfamily N-acetyltransferase